MTLRLSRQNVRHIWPLFAGSFVALGLGVVLLALCTILIWSVQVYADSVDPTDKDLLLALDDLMAMLGVVSGFAGFMAIFIVASTFSFTVNARRRELGLLRLVGASPKQVRRMVMGESLVVGVLASVFGCAVGWLLSPVVLWGLNRRGLAPDSIPLAAPWWPMAVAVGIGLTVAFLGARAAARRAAKVTPVQAMQETSVERGRVGVVRFLVGVVCLAGSLAMLSGIRAGSAELALAMAILVPEVIVVGLVCLGPLVVPLVVRVLTAPWRGHLLIGIARQNLLAMPRRSTSLAAPILAISAIAGSLILSLSFAADWDNGVTKQQLKAPVILTGASAAEGLEVAARKDVAVADNGLLVEAEILRDGYAESETFEGIDPAEAAVARGTQAHRGDLAALKGRTMAVARSFAWDYGIHLGDSVTVRFADGEQLRLKVVSEFEDATNLQQNFLLPRAFAEAHGGEPSETWFLVPSPDTSGDALVADLSGSLDAGVAMGAADWVAERDDQTRADNRLSLFLVLGPSALYAAIAIANTLLMGSLQRKQEFIATRLIGATEEQVRRLVVTEAALVSGVALALGGMTTVGVGLLLRAPMTAGLDEVQFTVPWLSLASVAVACVVIPVVAAVLPTRAVLRQASPARAASG